MGTNVSDKHTANPEDRSSEVLPNTIFTYKISRAQKTTLKNLPLTKKLQGIERYLQMFKPI